MTAATARGIAARDESLGANEVDIAKREQKLREALQRQNAVISRIESATQRSKMRAMYKGPRIEDAFAKFEIIERRAVEPAPAAGNPAHRQVSLVRAAT